MNRNHLLSLILIGALLITAWSVFARQKQTFTPQQWEYKNLIVWRPTGSHDFTKWYDSGVELQGPVNVLLKLNELGTQGWELVTMGTIASTSNSWGSVGSPSYDQSGFTNQINYLLKRPKQ